MSEKDIVVGYQYAPGTGRYIGRYEFPNNLDKEEIHLPPNTVLEAPPSATLGTHPYYNGESWVLRDEGVENKRPEIGNYAMLTDSTIALMKEQGIWTSEDQAARDAAVAGDTNAS